MNRVLQILQPGHFLRVQSKLSFYTFSVKMAAALQNEQHLLVAVKDARQFMIDCFTAMKTPKAHAIQMSDLLVEADYRGHFSHGMNRLEMYINDLSIKMTDSEITPEILKETPATAWVDGKNGLGAVVGNFCMDLAIQKAKNVGVGWVSARGSNHYGIAGWYTTRAEKEGLIGISMTNTSPIMSPTRSKAAALGTNPISFSAPANDGDKFVLDMATTAVAVGKIEIKRRKGEQCPLGWAQDPEGNLTTDADIALNTACLLPLGGAEETSGFKGYGLSTMVETLCGILAGANYGTNIRKWSLTKNEVKANLGQVFIAVDPNCFAPGFGDRLSDMLGILRGLPKSDPEKPVLVAGDRSRAHKDEVDRIGGIPYHINQIDICNNLSNKLNIKPIVFSNCR